MTLAEALPQGDKPGRCPRCDVEVPPLVLEHIDRPIRSYACDRCAIADSHLEQVLGSTHQTQHAIEGCSGWVLQDFAANGAGEDRTVYPMYRPCDVCTPGKFAVWKAGLMHGRWWEAEEAIAVYEGAQGEPPGSASSSRRKVPRQSV